MAELLTKEKQFLKLNEQLDRIATTSATNQEINGQKTPDGRFLTYQKTKGPSTLLRKQGAGDGITDCMDVTNTVTNIKETRLNTITLNKAGAGGETYRMSNRRHYGNFPEFTFTLNKKKNV